RFWAPGVYIKARFEGTSCEILLNDELLYGNSHNYISIIVDDMPPVRLQLKDKNNVIRAAENLKDTIHTLLIVKATEAGIGYLEFEGIRCKKLLPLASKAERKIEFIGNSITCGMGSDGSIPCGSGEWYDQHNAYLSYGPLTARSLNAEWILSAVSGIGMVHSCCGMKITMPQVFDKVNMRQDTIEWDFNAYQPDVVTVCLGQNDGKQDSTLFCSTYVGFLKRLRAYYPSASIVCLTSPMADETLQAVLKKYLTAVVKAVRNDGDHNVFSYFFIKKYEQGCDYHPNLSEHREIAAELTGYIKKIKKWD